MYLSIFIIILSIILILMMPINTNYELNNYSATSFNLINDHHGQMTK